MVVIASKPGQLGNRLYLFAHFIGSAIEHGFELMNPSFDEYANFFRGTRRDLFCRYPARESVAGGGAAARRLLYNSAYYLTRALVRGGARRGRVRAVALDWEEQLDLSDPAFLDVARRRGVVFVQGWRFRAHSAMKKHAAAIREFLSPVEEHEANVAALVTRARARGDVLVGVHMRRGDYRSFMGGQFYYEPETYAEVLRKVESLFPGRKVSFLVCSNETPDAAVFSGFDYRIGSSHFVEDMYALARCDYIVGPPSTYTMWASFYGATPLCMVWDANRDLTLEEFTVHGIDNVT